MKWECGLCYLPKRAERGERVLVRVVVGFQGGASHFTWPLCIRRRRGKQAKVTSGRQVYTSCGWFVCGVWWWQQRGVDADSKVGISSSYFMCACVSVCACGTCTPTHVNAVWRAHVLAPAGAGNEGTTSRAVHCARPDISRTLHRVGLGIKAQMKRSQLSRENPFPLTGQPFLTWSCGSAEMFVSFCDPGLRWGRIGPLHRADKMAAVAKLTGEAEEDGAQPVSADFQSRSRRSSAVASSTGKSVFSPLLPSG